MFGRKEKVDSKELTLVGANSTVDGDIKFTGHCHVDGLVNGSILADTNSRSLLTIVGDGKVDGGVNVPYVELNGIVRGDVVATQRVKLGATARVIGNVYYNLIEMAIGAEINGKLVHQPDGQVPLLGETSDDKSVADKKRASPVSVVASS